ncbi:hypothetical protein HGRIS_012972 [Hohenbuehelia grisea]|uniref:Uncharacterized protein n=1 Tax=Hohenbuehelia grisea TaxID=104357 RepID=A0ABR3ITY1_9AGAR
MSAYSRSTRRSAPSPGSVYTTPTSYDARTPLERPSLTRATSPPTSYASTISPNGHPKLNVVTKVAVEGKPSQDTDGASIRMYLKIALPLESISSGMTIPLFPEENVKIMKSHIHPLTKDGAPFKFPLEQCTLLHKAARALGLPNQSTDSYLSVFGPSPLASKPWASSIRSSRASSSSQHPEDEWPIDPKYTGDITVSNYQVSFVLPKEFPSLEPSASIYGDHDLSRSQTPYKRRRSSIGERHVLQFMAAIEMFIPYLSSPPRAPYLLCIPTPPKCLSNSIKLNVNKPQTTSNSLASLSSIEDEPSSWEFGFSPPITTPSTRISRANSVNSAGYADDESSDTSVRSAEAWTVQGTFQSTERLKVRWAKPTKTIADVPGDGRGRVGTKEVKGEMTCTVIEQARESVVMNVQYTGTCRDVWFPGVATMLGLDVGLVAKNSDVFWADGYESLWKVTGGTGYTGFDTNSPTRSRYPSMDLALPTPTTEPELHRNNSNSSTASLLRAPLPTQPVAEYSFEGSVTSSTATTAMSSVSSLPPSSQSNLFADDTPPATGNSQDAVRPPGLPVTLHLDIDALMPPARNLFTFTITGTIRIVPRMLSQSVNGSRVASPPSSSTESEVDRDPIPIVLPTFTVLAADRESTTTLIRNEIDSAAINIEVYNSSGDIYRDAQARKTVLQKSGYTKCSEEGVRIMLRSIGMSSVNGHGPRAPSSGPPSRPRTPTGSAHRLSHITSSPSVISLRPKRDGPLMIPSVTATVTPLILSDDRHSASPNAYAVRLSLAVPADAGSDWLEFGLAQLSLDSDLYPGDTDRPPNVEVASASVDGIPVRFETTVAVKQEQPIDLGLNVEQINGQEWLSWVRVHVAGNSGSLLVVDYIVKAAADVQLAKAQRAKTGDTAHLNVYLPTFTLPVGRLEVAVDDIAGFEVTSLRSNLSHRHRGTTGQRLLHLGMDELFYPQLFMTVTRQPSRSLISLLTSGILRYLLPIISLLLALVVLSYQLQLGREVGQLKRALDSRPPHVGSGRVDLSDPITVTTTVYATANSHRRIVDDLVETIKPNPFAGALPDPGPFVTSPEQDSASPSFGIHLPSLGASTYPQADGSSVEDEITETESLALTRLDLSQFIPSLQFDFIDIHTAMDKVLETLDVVWHVLRRMYHYPLDPP